MRARANKAAELVRILTAHGADVDQARALPLSGRRMAEALAGVSESSDATWELVASLFEQRSRWQADPFVGLPGCEAS